LIWGESACDRDMPHWLAAPPDYHPASEVIPDLLLLA